MTFDEPEILVAVFDQNPMLSLGICALLEKRPNVRAVPVSIGSLVNSDAGHFTIAVIDPSQTDQNPAQIAEHLKHRFGAPSVIGYFSDPQVAVARACLTAGFRGFLPKTSPFGALQTAIAAAQQGAFYFDASFGDLLFETPVDSVTPKPRDLTDREAYVLKSVARGKSLKEIGLELALSSKTIETYKARGSTKLNLQGRRAIVEYAIRSGWVQ